MKSTKIQLKQELRYQQHIPEETEAKARRTKQYIEDIKKELSK